MRITNLMLTANLMSGLRGRMSSIARASIQVSTGRRIQTISDDPVDASQVMRMEAQARDIDQYRRNGTFATTKLSTEDVALTSLRKVIQQAKNLAVGVKSANPSDPDRLAALNTAKALKDQMVALGNSKVGDEYIFGGDQSTTPPFQANGTYVGDTTVRSIPVNSGVTVAVNHAGQPLFTDALAAIDNMITQLQSGTPSQISASTQNLNDADQTALASQTEVGSRLQSIKNVSEQLGAQSTALLDRRDAVLNVDPAQAIVNMQQEQLALERSYSVIGRVMQASLTDYLR